MKRWKNVFIMCLVTVLTVFAAHAKLTEGSEVNTPDVQKTALTQGVNKDFGNVPLYFIPNNGQMDENARFYARTAAYTLWMTDNGLIFDSVKTQSAERPRRGASKRAQSAERDVSRLVFPDAEKNPVMVPESPAGHKVNYLRGNDKSKWHTNIPTSKAVRYKNLYKGIDLKVYGVEKQIEYDWVVKSGANPDDIALRYKNVKHSRIDNRGNLVIETAFGSWTHKRPVAYQVLDGKKVTTAIEFKKRESGKHTYCFDVGTYDKRYELVIDPMIVAYSTFLGGNSFDEIRGIEVDGTGSVYTGGSTQSTDFPTAYGYQGSLNGFKDAVITRLTPDGTGLVFSTYLGGSYGETTYDIALDGSGAIYVGGVTDSTDFPTVNAFQNTHNGGTYDGFIAKLSPDGSSLVYSTYLGGSAYEMLEAVTVNAAGELFICGATDSSDFPLQNAIQPVHGGGNDAYVAKLSSTGGSLVYSTFLGGGGSDIAFAVNVDAAGAAYVGGYAASTDFPTVNAFQWTKASTDSWGVDAFLTKISPDGSSLVYSTYLGGGNDETLYDIALDAAGVAYVTGSTGSTDFPTTPGVYQEVSPGGGVSAVAFVTKVSSSGSSLLYSTFLGGGSYYDGARGIEIDGTGAAYIAGTCSSEIFPMVDPFEARYFGAADPFIAVLSPDASTLTFSSYLGGSGEDDYSADIEMDAAGAVYIAGGAGGGTFPTQQGFQETYGGGTADGFVMKLVPGLEPPLEVTVPNGGEDWQTGNTYTVTWTSNGAATAVYIYYSTDNGGSWNFIDSVYPDTGSYDWTTPDTPSDQCLVKVTDDMDTVMDTSDDVFTLSGALSFEVVAPNGGDQLNMGYPYQIQWTTTGQVENVFIEFSSDGGGYWEPVTGPTPNTGYYDWIAPYIDSDQCLIKVRHEFLPVEDQTDSVFTILPPTITVLEPMGGDLWNMGYPYQIRWTTTGQVENVFIEFSSDGGGYWEPVTGPTPNTGYYDWIAPYIPSDQCLIKIRHETLPVEDQSDTVFTISPPTITVLEPMGGDLWNMGYPYQIRWTTTGQVENVFIEFSSDGGGYWEPVAGPIPNTGYYDWIAPYIPSGQCLIKIRHETLPVEDTSDTVFTILPPTITVTSPYGGELWDMGYPYQIQWTTTGQVENVFIEFSSDGGGNWEPITGPIPNTGYYDWIAPYIPSSQCLIKIRHETLPVEDTNDTFFTILPPTITVTSPYGGEELTGGFAYQIQWTTTGQVENVNLYFSGNGGNTWGPIDGPVPNTGYYDWTAPVITSAQCLVKVEHETLPVSGQSGAVFTITSSSVPTVERDALIALYNSTNGDNWTVNDNWRLPSDPSQFNVPGTEHTWAGVTCSTDGSHVEKIELYAYGLNGTIPVQLNDLTQLTTLDLRTNQLSGTVPALNNLSLLTVLNLSDNQLTGGMPDVSGSLNLAQLRLHSNQLDGALPAWLNTLTGLTTLELQYNQLTGTIPALGNLVALETLNLSSNQLTGSIPADLGNLTALRRIYLDNNLLTGGIPGELGNLTGLNILFLHGNDLTGALPSALSNLTALYNAGLNISWNGLYTADSFLRDFLNSKHASDWEAVQTVAPTGLTVDAPGYYSIDLTWIPIPYQADNGRYRVYYSTTPGSGFTLAGTTADKYTGSFTVTGLSPDTTYYFKVSTVTDAHVNNQNAVLSGYTPEISGTTSALPVMTVTAPDGGETWEAGTTQTITWNNTGSVDNVALDYSVNGGSSWLSIVGSVSNTGSYDWAVPAVESTNCLVRVSDTVTGQSDTSNAPFIIWQQPFITVMSPNGGETFPELSTRTITWVSAGYTGNVEVEYTTDNGKKWRTAATVPAGAGSCQWTLPKVNADKPQSLVRLTASDGSIQDVSDAYFTILNL